MFHDLPHEHISKGQVPFLVFKFVKSTLSQFYLQFMRECKNPTSSTRCHEHKIHDGIRYFLQQIVQIPTTPISNQMRSETQSPVQINFFADAHNSNLANLSNATFLT